MARRGENIYKRKDGRYEGRYFKGRNINGKILFGYIYGRTYTEVKQRLIKLKNSNPKLNVLNDKSELYETVYDYMTYWLKEYAEKNVKESTYIRYYERIHGYIIPAIGNLKLSKVSQEVVKSFIDNLKNRKLSVSTIKGVYTLLNSSMKKAVLMQLISSNPCENIKMPSMEKKELNVLNRSEQIAIEIAASGHSKMAEIYTIVSLYTGLRIGEICALKWQDIDLYAGTLFVRSTLQRIKNIDSEIDSKTIIIEGTPKSENSYRNIPISLDIVKKLKNYKAITNNPNNKCYVLSGNLKPIEPRTLRYDFKRYLKSNNIPDISFHTLRHTYATRCIEYNFDIKTLSELMGHSNVSTTLKVYTHSVTEHKRDLSERIRILSQFNEPSNKPSNYNNVV